MSEAQQGSEPSPPDGAAVEVFWREACRLGRLTELQAVLGVDQNTLVTPPAWQFDGDARQATRLAHAVVSGAKTVTCSVLGDYESEGADVPAVGDLGIVCDGRGLPRALVRTESVRVAPFDQVGADVARAEGEGLDLEGWRRAHVRLLPAFQGRLPDAPWPRGVAWPSDDMVVETLRCLYPEPPTGRRPRPRPLR